MTNLHSPQLETVSFPVGFHTFHKKKDINFQLNRFYSYGFLTHADVTTAGKAIKSMDNWRAVWTDFAADFLAQERPMAAAFCYRAAEFYALPDDPTKIQLYDRFSELFYGAIQIENLERFTIPYQEGALPAIRLSNSNHRGTIVMHGGFDSFLEELLIIGQYLALAGYEVIIFEGPGQGAAIRKHNLYFTHEWEHSVTCVLDYFSLTNVTLIGISLGGYLCLRAAAFEPRVTRVVSYNIATFDPHPKGLHLSIYEFFLRNPGFYNWIAKMSMKNAAIEWLMRHGMYINNVETPCEWMALLENFAVVDIADKVRQDVLLLAGAEDHMVNIKELEKNRQGLVAAKSVTSRVFTAEEHAQNHGQIGNIKLALDEILEWIAAKN